MKNVVLHDLVPNLSMIFSGVCFFTLHFVHKNEQKRNMNKWFIGLHTKKSEYHVQLEKKNTEMENLPVETISITYKKNLSRKRRSYNRFIPKIPTKKKLSLKLNQTDTVPQSLHIISVG